MFEDGVNDQHVREAQGETADRRVGVGVLYKVSPREC
jgi:hypothetical protein